MTVPRLSHVAKHNIVTNIVPRPSVTAYLITDTQKKIPLKTGGGTCPLCPRLDPPLVITCGLSYICVYCSVSSHSKTVDGPAGTPQYVYQYSPCQQTNCVGGSETNGHVRVQCTHTQVCKHLTAVIEFASFPSFSCESRSQAF